MQRSEIQISEDSFKITTPYGFEDIEFRDIYEVAAYKRDEFITDRICCDISIIYEGEYYNISLDEGMAGFFDLMYKFQCLEGFLKNWREIVVCPPFEQNHTILFKRQTDDDDEHAGRLPPKANGTFAGASEKSSKSWFFWGAACLIIAAVEVMNR